MSELQRILQLWEQARSQGQECVLGTVVKTQGSSYRLPGARFLLTPDGKHAGSISGGCLEEDLLKRAWWLTGNGPVIRRYDTTPDGEITTEYGLGCNGIIHVLLERVNPENCRMLDVLRDVQQLRKPASVVHILAPPSKIGTRFTGETDASAEEVFAEWIVPPVQLILCGAGDDALPLDRLAQFLGWRVLVYDGRARYARQERFPEAGLVTVREPGATLEFPGDPWTVAVIMTHSYSQDLEFLKELLRLKLVYLGVLGPYKRTSQLLQDLGLSPDDPTVTLHAPMGLDIGADGPEQVALAVVAEIQGRLNGRDGGPLRNRTGSIHASESGNQAAYLPSYSCV